MSESTKDKEDETQCHRPNIRTRQVVNGPFLLNEELLMTIPEDMRPQPGQTFVNWLWYGPDELRKLEKEDDTIDD
jgi:hypothetical protein